jgi:diguanylate cyclase (GGDEF)-like protein
VKLSSIRSDLVGGERRRREPAADAATSPGLDPTDLSPAALAALDALSVENEALRREVGRLKARLAEAEDQADRDALTPLLNRRAFVRELGRVAMLAQRHGTPASLIYFDLDRFKAVNDAYGHAAGDAVLQAVAARLSAQVRGSDVVGRLGGDEFGVILMQADLAAAQAKAAALAKAIESEAFVCGEWLTPLKISYGVREIEPGCAAEMVLAEADAAMFARKRKT